MLGWSPASQHPARMLRWSHSSLIRLVPSRVAMEMLAHVQPFGEGAPSSAGCTRVRGALRTPVPGPSTGCTAESGCRCHGRTGSTLRDPSSGWESPVQAGARDRALLLPGDALPVSLPAGTAQASGKGAGNNTRCCRRCCRRCSPGQPGRAPTQRCQLRPSQHGRWASPEEMEATGRSPTSQTDGKQLLKSRAAPRRSPVGGGATGTRVPRPQGLRESPRATSLLLRSLGLLTATSPPLESPHPRAARQTLEHPSSHPGPLLALGTPGCCWGPVALVATSAAAGGCAEAGSGLPPAPQAPRSCGESGRAAAWR